MSADPYLAARAHFIETRSKLALFAGFLGSAANALVEKPSQVVFTNTPRGLQIEEGIAPQGMDAEEWKSVDQIQGMLREYKDAKNQMLEAWSAIPSNLRPGLVAPPATP